jgi:hypothetical protein
MYLIALLVLFAAFGVFAFQNDGTQAFTFLGYTASLPTWAPAAIGTGIASILLMLHMSHAGMGSRFRAAGHDRAIDEHRDVIERLRAENTGLREQLAAARGRIDGMGAVRGAPAPRRTWRESLRDASDRMRNRRTA